MGYSPGYRFVHNLPNKPLTGYSICRILKTKDLVYKIFKTLELWFLWSFGRHKPEPMDSVSTCLYLYAGCQQIVPAPGGLPEDFDGVEGELFVVG
jgi:hypothetical protein